MIHTCTYTYDVDGKNMRDILTYTSKAKTRSGIIRAAEKAAARDVEDFNKGRFAKVLTVDGNAI